MHDIIEHYGKVVIALFAIVAALAIAAIIVAQVTTSTKKATADLDTKYKDSASEAVSKGNVDTP